MNKLFAPFLPPWAETGLQPAFYDLESGTVLQQTARMYAKVQQLTRLFNELSEETKTTVEEYIAKFVELKDFVDNYFDNLDVQEEINNKLDDMAESGVLTEIIAEYAQTKVDYFYIDSETSEADILSAFASPKTKVIEFAYGEYTLTSDLILTSNTTVNLNGASIIRDSSSLMLLGYAKDSTYTAYNGVHNITFNNGKIGYPIALMHNDNIKFIDIEFLPVSDHAIQIASSKDIEIKGCTFDGRTIDDSRWEVLEMLQLESATRAGQPFLNDEDSVSYDDGGNYNILIEGCKFLKGDWETTRNYIAIGHHSDNANNHYFNENITIRNCLFESSYYSQMCPAGFNNCVIEGCKFNQINEINEIYNIRFRFLNKDVTIKNSEFIGGDFNINNVNQTGYNTNLILENNTFTSEFEHGDANLCLRNWDGIKVLNNIFLKRRIHNITLRGDTSSNPTKNVLISGNSFDTTNIYETTNANVIYLDKCESVSIKENKVKIAGNLVIVYINASTSSKYSMDGNLFEYSGSYTTIVSGTSGWDSSQIKDIPITCYYGNAGYTALTDQTPTQPFTNFDTLLLLFHRDNGGTYAFEATLKPLFNNGKFMLDNIRHYNFSFKDSAYTYEGEFTINTDGTFSYSSSTSNLTLRLVKGLNTI